uniref:hypothetical protein n=1 Tax=Pseudomonas sp. FW305-55 TaxID=2751339 RepID=UPI001A91B68C
WFRWPVLCGVYNITFRTEPKAIQVNRLKVYMCGCYGRGGIIVSPVLMEELVVINFAPMLAEC